MRLVRQNLHTSDVCKLHNRPDIRADTVVCRIIHQYRHRVRIILNGLPYLVRLHSQGDPQSLIHLRVHIDRNSSAENQGVNHAFMYIARENDLISCTADRKDHRLYCRGRPAYHQICSGRSKCFSCQLLGLFDYGNRMA